MDAEVYKAITAPDRLWAPEEIRVKPCPVPKTAGVYGWYFRELPANVDVSRCIQSAGMTLLYVGIAPGRPGSRSDLRRRLRQHIRDRGSSTLRRTLAALMADRLSLVPKAGVRGRLGLGDEGETRLSDWIAANAAVTWAATPEPWSAEEEFLQRIDLPLNLMHNSAHPFAVELSASRAEARRLLREAQLRPLDS